MLLIDADLRHPSVARKLGLEGHVGLSHVLSGQASPKELIERARVQYDYVILDTTPLSVANDAVTFGKMANGVILVVGKGVGEKKDLQETVRSLEAVDVPVLGFVLNFADPKRAHSNAYYYYSQDSKQSDTKSVKI